MQKASVKGPTRAGDWGVRCMCFRSGGIPGPALSWHPLTSANLPLLKFSTFFFLCLPPCAASSHCCHRANALCTASPTSLTAFSPVPLETQYPEMSRAFCGRRAPVSPRQFSAFWPSCTPCSRCTSRSCCSSRAFLAVCGAGCGPHGRAWETYRMA